MSSIGNAWRVIALGFAVLAWTTAGALGADNLPTSATPEATSPPGAAEEAPQTPTKVTVEPLARDNEIRDRLKRILDATGWFTDPQVRVDEGVVFLAGTATDDEYRKWAEKLAGSTQDVVAVVNHMSVARPMVWDFRPAVEGLRELWIQLLRWLPFIAFGLLILLATFAAARFTNFASRRLLLRRLEVPLLRNVIARACALIVLIVGLYIVLRVSGLTRLALTVVGGTGLLGLVIGIAFRDITENFLASIFLSIQRPFLTGDVVEIDKVMGIVERLTIRTTIIMTYDGNHAQIPNSTVYKSVIHNYSSNPNRRDDFVIGIGYSSPVADAQEIALAVLRDHPAVLRDPEPWVLVDGLGASTVDLRVYFWLNGLEHSPPKVRSSVIRLIKCAFAEAGIEIPDSAREVVFPRGVPLRLIETDGDDRAAEQVVQGRVSQAVEEPTGVERAKAEEPVATNAEAGLESENQQMEEQSRHARSPEPGVDLLQDSAAEAEDEPAERT